MGEIAIRAPMGAPSEHELMVFQTMAKSAIESKMYRGVGEQAGVMMIMLAARELGIPPCQALNGGLNIIQGKVEISARMMSALIRRAGHQIQVQKNDDSCCVLVGKRSDTGETLTASFTIEEAQKAGLVKPGGGWVKWPKDMCFARALSRLARQLFSDVIGIGYVEGEIKEAECQIIIPEEITPIVEHDYEGDLKSLTQHLDKDDLLYFNEYLKVVMEHFGWSKNECLKKFVEDKDLFDKFNKWKSKQVNNES